MNRAYRIVGVILLAQFSCSCGTVINGKYQKVYIESEPSQARAYIPGTDISGETPFTVKLKRKDNHIILVEKDGYQKKSVYIERHFWVPALLNIIIWPLLFVDLFTGGWYELEPDKALVILEAKDNKG